MKPLVTDPEVKKDESAVVEEPVVVQPPTPEQALGIALGLLETHPSSPQTLTNLIDQLKPLAQLCEPRLVPQLNQLIATMAVAGVPTKIQIDFMAAQAGLELPKGF